MLDDLTKADPVSGGNSDVSVLVSVVCPIVGLILLRSSASDFAEPSGKANGEID